MQVHLFRGQGRVFGATADASGANLPKGYGPWSAFKTLDLAEGQAQPGLDVDECLRDIGSRGFHVTDAHVRITDQALRFAAPVFCVADVAATADYLTGRLGFRIEGRAGDPPEWMSLQRDRVEIMLVRGDSAPPPRDWAAYLYVGDADSLYAEFEASGADLVAPPADKPYGNREFEVRLPDGRLLAFGS